MFSSRRFLILLSLAVVLCEMFLAFFMWRSAPAGTRWLGDTIQNSSDVAVYLSYIGQGADGHVLLQNFFAVEPHARRFDLVWSTLGLVARSGFPPILIHETARWLFSVLLILSLFAAARFVTQSERYARIATLLAIGGVGTGWLYSLWLSARGLWQPTTYAAADVVTEFSVAPTLLGGAHMILSLALLITGLRLAWTSFQEHRFRTALYAAICFSILFLFHPYFIPLVGLYIATALVIFRRNGIREISLFGLIFAFPLVPAAVVYVPLAFDPVFRTHHLVVNELPLAPWLAWIMTLLPFIAASVWRWKKRLAITSHEQWLMAWIAVALVCMLLPLPWTRKYTEGVGTALVFLTLPAWISLWEFIKRIAARPLVPLMAGVLLFAASLTPLHLFASQLAWVIQPDKQSWFYRSDDVFAAWKFLRTTTQTQSIVLSDDRWINIWTPAYAHRTVWVAHDHETPDFQRKRGAWNTLLTTNDPTEAQRLLFEADVTYFITTTNGSTQKFKSLLGQNWRTIYSRGQVTIFGHVNPLRNLALLPNPLSRRTIVAYATSTRTPTLPEGRTPREQ